MIELALRGIWTHKRRLIGSLFAVFIGVSFLSGALTLTDTLRSSIDDFFAHAYAGTDVAVRSAVRVDDSPGARRGMIDGSLVGKVRRIEGVAVAEPVIEGSGRLLDENGVAIEVQGPRNAGNWVTTPGLNPYHVVRGRAPRAPNEVVINKGVAEDGHLRVGDTTAVLTPQRVPVKVVGITKFGDQDAFGGTSFTAFGLAGARMHIATSPDRVTSIVVRAEPGVTQAELTRRIEAVLPQGTEAITGAELTEENSSVVTEGFVSLFRTFLLVFAGIALLVGVFGIFNTFSIIVAQRTEEWALLRAVGASRGQTLFAVVVEASAIGLVASAIGLGGGLGLAIGLEAVFTAMGAGLPTGGLVFTWTTVAVSVPVGVVVTLLACAIPAVRASRVPPLAALREAAAEHGGPSRGRTVIGCALTAAGAVGVLLSVVTGAGMEPAGLGAAACVIGMVVLGPAVVRPVCGVLGAPLRGVTGALARRNVTRVPRRTAGAATALMIGVGVVTLFTVVAASMKASIEHTVSASFGGDLVVDAGDGFGGFDPKLATDLGKLPEVAIATGTGTGSVLLDGHSTEVRVIDPQALGRVLHPSMTAGSLNGLGPDELAVSDDEANSHGWRTGTRVMVEFADGSTQAFRIDATYSTAEAVGDYLMPKAAWAAHTPQELDSRVFVTLRDGVDPADGKAAVTRVTRAYGAPPVRDRKGYVDARTASVNALLTLVYVMLALAILIALLGIANTLSLSVHERTRELGLLRAVGATRHQIRSMVRRESLIIALFGTAGGLGVGLFLGWGMAGVSEQIGSGAFAAPVGQLIVIVAVGGAAGLLAGLRPARRAARLRVLDAVAAP